MVVWDTVYASKFTGKRKLIKCNLSTIHTIKFDCHKICQNNLICVRGCLHESGLSFNPDRTRSVSVEIIGD